MKMHNLSDSDAEIIFLAVRPFIYVVLFVELQLKPYKKIGIHAYPTE